MHAPRLPLIAAALAPLALVVACSGGSSDGSAYEVKAGDDSCEVSATEVPAGQVTLEVENTGSKVTEVYVYGKDGDEFTKIMGEKENIGPGTTQKFDVDLAAGDYEVACKPGMTGDGIRQEITVTGEGGSTEGEEAYDKELEFEVAADGSVTPPADLTAGAGDRIEFKIENGAEEEYYLTVLDADSAEIGEGEAEGGAEGEFIAELPEAGDYRVQVYPDGAEDQAEVFTLTVS